MTVPTSIHSNSKNMVNTIARPCWLYINRSKARRSLPAFWKIGQHTTSTSSILPSCQSSKKYILTTGYCFFELTKKEKLKF